MPELPEVHVMVQKIRGWRGVAPAWIQNVSILRNNGKYLPNEELVHLLGSIILGVQRIGKFIVFECDTGTLVGHNAMSGYWDAEHDPWTFDYVEGVRRATNSDVRVTLSLESKLEGIRVLRFHDARLFGSLRFYAERNIGKIKSLMNLGPDALDPVEKIIPYIRKRSKQRTIKEVLMDQSAVAGIGNIYATEALYSAGIMPNRRAAELDDSRMSSLLDFARRRMMAMIDNGINYNLLSAYRQTHCPFTHPIQKMNVKGRSSYFCPECQS